MIQGEKSKSVGTFAGEGKGLFEVVEAGDGLLGRALSEQVPGEEAGKVLDSSVNLVAAHCGRRELEPWLDVDDYVGHVEVKMKERGDEEKKEGDKNENKSEKGQRKVRRKK